VALESCQDAVVSGCTITGSGGQYTSPLQPSGVGIETCTNVIVQGCDLTNNTEAPLLIDTPSTPTSMICDNIGYNPTGYVDTGIPAAGESGHSYANPNPQYATIYMDGIDYVTIDGTQIGTTADPPSVVRLGPGQSIAFHFSPTPTVKWFYD
jgi:hypothetical protein